MKASKAKITRRLVEATHPDPDSEVRVWDTELRGFCLRVWPSGRKVYSLKYRVGGVRQRWIAIGEHGSPWTADTARAQANDWALRVRGFRSDPDAAPFDPAEVRAENRRAISVSDLIELYLKEGPRTNPDKRASSWDIDRGNLNHHVKPLLGTRRARDLQTRDIAGWQTDVADGKTATSPTKSIKKRGRTLIRGGRGAAGRALGSLSAMLAWAVAEQIIPKNPAAAASGLKTRIRTNFEPQFLSDDEAQRLRNAIDELEKPRPRGLKPGGREYGPNARPSIPDDHAAAMKLLMLTGARRGEILGLKWSELDLQRGQIRLPPERHKTGKKGKSIELGAEAIAILSTRPKRGGVFVFPDATLKKPLYTIKRSWSKVTAKAELPGLRLHDLRHSFASFAVADGVSLYVVGKALGHAQAATTQRYAHLKNTPVQRTVAGVERRYSSKAVAANADSAEIIELPTKDAAG